MGKQQSPVSPDPKSIASMQLAGNISSSMANLSKDNINQVTPDGTLQYNQVGTSKIIDPFTGNEISIPQYTQTYSLNPLAQEIYDKRNINQNLLSDILTNNLKTFAQKTDNPVNSMQSLSMPNLQTDYLSANKDDLHRKDENILYNYGKDGIQNYEKALFDRLEPHLKQDRQSLETKLSNQGFLPGSVAWDRAVDENNRQYNDARLATLLKSSEEQERMDNMQAKRAYFHNLAQSQDHQQKIAHQQQSLHEILSLMQAISPPKFSMPQHNNASVDPVDYKGIVQNDYQNRVFDWKEKQKNLYDSINIGNQLLKTLVSDRRMKRDIKPVASLYQYRYQTDPSDIQRIGVVAQEISKIRPDAVMTDSQGVKSVDYGRLFNFPKYFRKRK
ncbi:MAG: hypothetical protein C4617_03780 [Candidatus Liberibacter europaeus]|uniref:Peptidase S74 domain-containing protein n=1 Tax=Candidatus Liberibacter europaeus TaxID=744859 RepID=A0A2T4VX29_9HYPH|nr:hypothetical protein [Candidatus Liberibacter europaeus]PTL86334.1 MAG: hypothetical protein C4617_03780 [Candidatus Liberibacter europaeus]